MTYAIIIKKGKHIKLASNTGYRTKEEAEQMKRIYQRTNKEKGFKFCIRKVS